MYGQTSSSVLVGSLPPGDVSVYKYKKAKKALNIKRCPRVLQPTNNQTFTTGQNDIMKFRFPTSEPIDPRDMYLLVDVTINTTGGTYKRLAFGSWSWIDKLRIHSTGETIEEIQYYNRLYSALFELASDPDYQDAIGPEIMGTGIQAQRNADGAVTTRYLIPLSLGYFTVGVLPMHALRNNYQELELFLASANTFVETDGTNASVTISNADLHYYGVSSWDGSYERSLQAVFDKSEFQVFFDSMTSFQNNIFNQFSDLVISNRQEAVTAIITWMFDNGNTTNTLVNDKFVTMPKNNCFSYQLKIGSNLWPEEEIECTGRAIEAYQFYQQWLGMWRVSGMPHEDTDRWPLPRPGVPNINNLSFNQNNFFMVLPFESSPGEDVMNNFSTEGCTDLIFKLKLTAPPPANSSTMHCVFAQILVQFLASGKPLVSY